MHEIEDRRSYTGRIQIPIPDYERRRSHIDLIDPTHPLLPTALSCLSYSERERPSALDLCQLLAALKGSSQYTQSVHQVQERGGLAPRATAAANDRELSSLQEANRLQAQQNHQLAQQNQELQQQLVAVREQNLRQQRQNERQSQRLQQRVVARDKEISTLQQQVAARDERTSTLEQQLEVRKNQSESQAQELHHQIAVKDARIQTLRQQLVVGQKQNERQVRDLQQQVAARDERVSTLEQQLEVRKSQSESQAQELHHRQKQNEHQVRDLRQQLVAKDENIETLQQQLVARDARTEAMRSSSQELQTDTLAVNERIQRLEQAYLEKQHTVQQLEKQLQANEQVVADFQLANDQLVQELERIRRPVEGTAIAQAPVQSLNDPQQQQITLNISWQKGDNAPNAMSRGATASKGEVVYVNPSGSPTVHAYNSRRQYWFRLPDCPHTSSAMVIVRRMVTAVGGQKNSEPTNVLLSLDEETKNWKECFLPMPTERHSLAAVCTGRLLIAAGGYCSSVLKTVEILDIDSRQWFTATSLPHPCYQPSAAVWEDTLYLLSGSNQNMNPVRTVLTCSVSELLQSCQLQTPEQSSLWHQIALAPFFNSTCVTLRGRLLAIGGNDATDKNTRTVHFYNPTSNSWQAMRTMPTARHCALVGVLPGDQLMVVGGWGEQRVLWNREPARLATVEFCFFS